MASCNLSKRVCPARQKKGPSPEEKSQDNLPIGRTADVAADAVMLEFDGNDATVGDPIDGDPDGDTE